MAGHRASLRARLQYATVSPNCFHQHASFAHGERQRFFQVDVFAGQAGLQGGQHVPVIGCRDDHGVDVRGIEQFAIVLTRTASVLHGELFRAFQVAVSCRHDAAFRRQGRQLVTAASHTDVPDTQSLIRAAPTRPGQSGRRNHPGGSRSRGGQLQTPSKKSSARIAGTFDHCSLLLCAIPARIGATSFRPT